MNILLINHYAGSPSYGMEYRSYYLAREWVRMGHHVTIVGGTYSHLRIRQPEAGEEIIDGIRYIWLPTPSYQGNGVKRALSMAAFVSQLYLHQSFVVGGKPPEIVIASSTYPLDIYPARHIANKYHAKLVFEVHDIWPLTPMEIGHMSKYHPFIWVMQKAEDYACRHVDKIISILPKAEPHYKEHGLAEGKFFAVPNGIDLDEMETVPKPSQCNLRSFCKEDEKIVLFAGAHGIANALDVLLDAAAMLRSEPVTVMLIGNGAEKERLSQRAKKEGLENVVFLPAVAKTEIAGILAQADILYIGLAKSPLFQFGISPNKMMDYMYAAKPVINAIDAGNDMTVEADCGYSVPAGNAVAVAEAIREMALLPEEERRRMGQNGKRYVEKNHDYRKLAGRFLDAVCA